MATAAELEAELQAEQKRVTELRGLLQQEQRKVCYVCD